MLQTHTLLLMEVKYFSKPFFHCKVNCVVDISLKTKLPRTEFLLVMSQYGDCIAATLLRLHAHIQTGYDVLFIMSM